MGSFWGHKDKKRAPHQSRGADLAAATSCHQHGAVTPASHGTGGAWHSQRSSCSRTNPNISHGNGALGWCSSTTQSPSREAPMPRCHQHPHSPSEPAGIGQTQPSRRLQLLSCLWECLLQLHRHQRLRGVCKSQHYHGCKQLLLMMPLRSICSAFCHRTQSGFGSTAAPAQPHKQDLTLPG